MRLALFVLLGALCLTPWASSALALFAGIALGLAFRDPAPPLGVRHRAVTHRLLTSSIIGLGAGMNLEIVARVGAHGILYTATGILLTLLVGSALARLFGVARGIGDLVAVGTAICGGSAIAAVAPVIRARGEETSVALATVFLLNAVALVLFPWIGHALHLAEPQFGLWAALAIHDTSSVVGAGLAYGPQALKIATTVKLARALWIVPVTLGFATLVARGEAAGPRTPRAPVRVPWFIFGFIAAAALVTWVPALQTVGHGVETMARRALILALFLIGASLNRAALRAVGVRPLALALTLWVLIASVSLAAVAGGWIGL